MQDRYISLKAKIEGQEPKRPGQELSMQEPRTGVKARASGQGEEPKRLGQEPRL
jgi:hypothetical protein